jgi:hypothetical protein
VDAKWQKTCWIALLLLGGVLAAPAKTVAQQPQSPESGVSDEPHWELPDDAAAQWATPPSTSDAEEAEEVEEVEEWYGGHTLLTDGASLLVVLLAAASESPSLAWAGAAGYVFGGPFVHLGHHNHGTALLSLGMRVGLAWVGAVVGAGMDLCRDTRRAVTSTATASTSHASSANIASWLGWRLGRG